MENIKNRPYIHKNRISEIQLYTQGAQKNGINDFKIINRYKSTF